MKRDFAGGTPRVVVAPRYCRYRALVWEHLDRPLGMQSHSRCSESDDSGYAAANIETNFAATVFPDHDEGRSSHGCSIIRQAKEPNDNAYTE